MCAPSATIRRHTSKFRLKTSKPSNRKAARRDPPFAQFVGFLDKDAAPRQAAERRRGVFFSKAWDVVDKKWRYASLRARTRPPARASVGISPGQFFRKQVSLSTLLAYRRFLSTRGRNRERTHSKCHLREHTPSEAASLGETGGQVGEAGSDDSSHRGVGRRVGWFTSLPASPCYTRR